MALKLFPSNVGDVTVPAPGPDVSPGGQPLAPAAVRAVEEADAAGKKTKDNTTLIIIGIGLFFLLTKRR